MLNSIISTSTGEMSLQSVIICTAVSIILGLGVAMIYMYKNSFSSNFLFTLALLPVIVQIVIMMVNGNLGTGVAVMGAFSLVRFRSAPGSAKEIVSIFFAMALGIATGMGYVGYSVIFFAIVGAMMFLLTLINFGERKSEEKELNITIPESLDYTGLFDDLFGKYTDKADLTRVKTTNMGSLYQLSYHIELRDSSQEKEFIDEIRCRNGNLNIVCGRVPKNLKDEL